MPIVVPRTYTSPAPPLTVVSVDGHLTAAVDTTWDGVLLKIDYSGVLGSYSAPFTATVWRRNLDGTLYKVRSGDPTLGYSGVCYAYDHEAPLGVPVRYYVVPVDTGVPSGGVVVTIPARAGGMPDLALWLKCLDNTSLSLRVAAVDSKTGNWSNKTSVDPILGSKYPNTTPVARQGKTANLVFKTFTMADYDAVLALIATGLVMIQSPPNMARRDGFFQVLDVSAASSGGLAQDAVFDWTFAIVEIGRPGTASQTLDVPGYSFLADGQTDTDVGYPPYITYGAEGDAGPYTSLITGNRSTFITSIADWLPGSNTSYSRNTVSPLRALAQNIKMVSTAAGSCSVITTAYVGPIAPGQAYQFRCWVRSPSALTWGLQIDWRNSAGTFLSSSFQSQAVPANTWVNLSFKMTAPTNAVQCTPIINPTATAGGQSMYAEGPVELIPLGPAGAPGPFNANGFTYGWAAV